MKNTMTILLSAATMVLCSATQAATQTELNAATTKLLSSDDIHLALKNTMADNVDFITTQLVNSDMPTIIAQTQLETELNQFIEQAKSDLPKNRFRVVFAD